MTRRNSTQLRDPALNTPEVIELPDGEISSPLALNAGLESQEKAEENDSAVVDTNTMYSTLLRLLKPRAKVQTQQAEKSASLSKTFVPRCASAVSLQFQTYPDVARQEKELSSLHFCVL